MTTYKNLYPLQQKYSHALTRVVEDTKRQMLEEHEKSIKALQEKHKKDITDILQESFAGMIKQNID